MKKTLCIIFAALMLAASVTACQKSNQKEPGSTGTASSSQEQTTLNTTNASTSKPTSTTSTTKQPSTGAPPTSREPEASQAMRPNGKKYISVSFDDGPGPYTNQLLDGLKERGVKATFFMLGSQVKQYPNTVKRIVTEGHVVGSHTYDHKDLKKMSDAQVKKELDDTDNALMKAAGVTSTALRPPYGSFTNAQMKKVDKLILLWSVDPEDWKYRNAQAVCDSILKQAKNGSIILSHDIYKTTVDGVLKAIDILQKQGYIFVKPDELLRRGGHEVQFGKPYYNGYPAAPKATAQKPAA